MKFSYLNLKPKAATMDIDAYKPPVTLASDGEKAKTVSDSCFAPVRTMLEHSAGSLLSEGVPVFPGYTVLCGLTQNGLIRSGVEMRAKEMTRKWGELVSTESNNDRIEAINNAMDTLNVKRLFRDIAEQCGFMGGCLIYIDTGEKAEELVNPIAFGQGTERNRLKGLRIVDPWVCSPGGYNSNNPLAADYFKPSYWFVQSTSVSSTRLIRVVENELPDLIKPAYNFFGMSLTQRVLDAVSHFTRNRESASKLLEKVALVVLKTDMQNILSGQIDNDLDNRMKFFTQNWDFNGVAMIDKENEDLAIFNNSLSGIVDIVRQSMEYVAAMFNEPATKLWGISPAGMNATGESDMQNHYDNIASLQERIFSPVMKHITDIIQLDLYGNIDKSITFKWAPLSEKSEASIAELNKMKAETASIYNDMGALAPEEIRNELVKDPDSGYGGLPEYAPLPTQDPDDAPVDGVDIPHPDVPLFDIPKPGGNNGV